MDIVEFLTAKYAEEAALARRLADRYVIPEDAYIVEEKPERAGQSFWPIPSAEAAFRRHPDPGIRDGLELVRMYSPARVLADVKAKQELLALVEEMRAQGGWGFHAFAGQIEDALAAPYRGQMETAADADTD